MNPVMGKRFVSMLFMAASMVSFPGGHRRPGSALPGVKWRPSCPWRIRGPRGKRSCDWRAMLGRPYLAFSLDKTPTETLRLDLTSFDCVLFVEQLLALVHSQTSDDFPKIVRRLRYQDAQTDYCQRHHYFSLWARNAERLGLVKDLSTTLPGAVSRVRRLTFMSSHPGSYQPMKAPGARQCITALERNLEVRQTVVPLSALTLAASKLQSGDGFAFATSVPGLDVTHTGFLERTPSGLTALHAIPDRGVVRSPDFVRHASQVEDVVGVSIHRPLSPPRGTSPR
jgi:hypothetical protein